MGVEKPSGERPEDGIGDRIRQCRERSRLSQSQLHQRTKEADPDGKGVARTVLIGYEAGKFKPGARELRILAATLAVDVRWLLLGDERTLDADLEQVGAALLAGSVGGPKLSIAFELALTLLCLKDHEREALATLILGMLSGRKGLPDPKLLAALGDWMAHDAYERLRQVDDQADLFELVSAKGRSIATAKVERLIRAFEELQKDRNNRAS